MATPAQMRGPFYPVTFPLDKDNDTVKPVAYPGRAPHIHFAQTRKDLGTFSTQMYVAGAPENERDFLLSGIRDRKARSRLIVPLSPAPAIAGELAGRFDIVLAEVGMLRQGALHGPGRFYS